MQSYSFFSILAHSLPSCGDLWGKATPSPHNPFWSSPLRDEDFYTNRGIGCATLAHPRPLAAGALAQGKSLSHSVAYFFTQWGGIVSKLTATPLHKKTSAKAEVQAFALCGERGIRTPGTVIPYDSLANCWFKPLTHLSVFDLKSTAKINTFHFTANFFALFYFITTFFAPNLLYHTLSAMCIILHHMCNLNYFLSFF